MKKILIYDDEERFSGEIRRSIMDLDEVMSTFEVEIPSKEELKDSLKVLEDRRRSFRENGIWGGEQMALDDASIFIVDYDLFDVLGFVSGHELAYLARCFSSCGLIVGYRYGDDAFDLTLRGESQSFVDLYVGGEQLGKPGLWGVEDVTEMGFRPWYWPILPGHLSAFQKRVEDVKASLAEDLPIYHVLDFAPESFTMLPRSASQFLGDKPTETTFRQFVTKPGGNGLERRDAASAGSVSDDVVARVGAARISKWLEWLVLPEQDILVDAPHLVLRYPSLLTGDVNEIQAWNKTTQLTSHHELGISTDLIEVYRLKKDHWLSRPAWFWDNLRESEKMAEVREPWVFEKPNWVFCEDMSRFYDRQACREFVAAVESPFRRRFVRVFDDIDYRPKVRFSL